MSAGTTAGAPLRQALGAWARSDGSLWLYQAKMLLAASLTLWLAMRLQLPHPSSAVITVFIVMQPQSGQVLAKSFYRVMGTLLGLAVMLVLIALFAQERVPFLIFLALWIGLCVAGSARHRDFRSYACMLAGYTAALIGIPAALNADTAFMSAVMRVLAITLGVLCSGAVSAAVFPQTSATAMRATLYRRMGGFAGLAADVLRGRLDRPTLEAAGVRLAAEAVGLESLRSASAFEDPHMRMRSGRLARLNAEFMGLTTRLHALSRLLMRLRERDAQLPLTALERLWAPLLELFEEWRGQALTDRAALTAAARLEQLHQGLRPRIRALRAELPPLSETDRRDFETAVELLFRFTGEWHGYLQTHASLAAPRHSREQWKPRFVAKANALGAAVTGIRSAFLVLVLGAFWIASAYPSGGMLALNAAAVSALASASPDPKRTALQMAVGASGGVVLGFFLTFFVFPWITGLPLLLLTLAPVFMLGTWISLRPGWMGYGLGCLVFFCFTSIPDNPPVYDAYAFINNGIAVVLSMVITAAVSAVLLPPNSPWLWRRLERDLRQQLVRAVSAPLPHLAPAFEGQTRDLLNQAYGVSAGRGEAQRRLIGWAFAVLEIGHAVIELRQLQARLPNAPRYAEGSAWRQAIRVLGRALVRLFLMPGAENLRRALAAVDAALAAVTVVTEPPELPYDESPLRQVQSDLHFIRSALLDPQGPLARYLEIPHAT